MKYKLLIFSLVMWFTSVATTAIAGGRPIPPGNVGDNIAFNKSYTMSPTPNYSPCSDAGDTTQLTTNYFNFQGH